MFTMTRDELVSSVRAYYGGNYMGEDLDQYRSDGEVIYDNLDGEPSGAEGTNIITYKRASQFPYENIAGVSMLQSLIQEHVLPPGSYRVTL